MNRRYTQDELRSKLSQYANARIDHIACSEEAIYIRFKEGFGSTYGESFSQELYVSTIKEMKEACKTSVLISLDSWQAQQVVDEINDSYLEAKEIEEDVKLQVLENQANDEEEIQKVWNSLEGIKKEAIDSLACDDKGTHIRLKDGYRLDYQKKYVKEAFIPKLPKSVWSTLNSLCQAEESMFLFVEDKINELSPEAKENIDSFDYQWAKHPFALPISIAIAKMGKFDLGIRLKKPNDFQSERPRWFLLFTFEDLRNGKHLEAFKPEHFLGTHEYKAKKGLLDTEDNENKLIENQREFEDTHPSLSYMKEKYNELSPEVKDKIEWYSYSYNYGPKDPGLRERMTIRFKDGILNDCQCDLEDNPQPYLTLTFKALAQGAHLKATEAKHFVGTPEYNATLKPLECP